MKKVFVVSLVLVMVTTALLAIPASAARVNSTFPRPNCGCGSSVYFYSEYSGGLTTGDSQMCDALAHVSHSCDRTYAYVSMKCWIAPWSSLNNYRSRVFTNSASDNGYGVGAYGSQPGMATAEVYYNFNDTYALLGVENYYQISVTHNGVEYASQEWSSDGDIPLSYIPPVVTE